MQSERAEELTLGEGEIWKEVEMVIESGRTRERESETESDITIDHRVSHAAIQ